jgi:hypothetical protein
MSSLAPDSQTAPWSAEGWEEVKERLPGLMAEEQRLRRQGWLN